MKKMVGWYDPLQLLDTAGKTIVSTIIGENADQRLTNASVTHEQIFDYSTELKVKGHGFVPAEVSRDEIWIDYVADVGDGWNSTATVAHYLACGSMPNSHTGGGRRGDLMIFGGDEVYPTANEKVYHERLIAPYEQAAVSAGIHPPNYKDGDIADLAQFPHVFAIPGNHDWYDSLNAFRYLFCAPYFNSRIFAKGWRTRQHRSYFALKLPFDWWILGLDFQLTHNIDWVQLEYFESIIGNKLDEHGQRIIPGPRFDPGSKVIICSPEPLWVYEAKYRRVGNETPYTDETLNLHFVEKAIGEAGGEVRLFIAGDTHHYRRFASTDDRFQKITAGGGGAFLHPTHDIDLDSLTSDSGIPLSLKSEYPDKATSRKLGYRNLIFPIINPKFGTFCMVLYGLLAGLRFFDPALAALVSIFLLFGLIFFTDSNSRMQKWVGGTLHALSHILAVLLGYEAGCRIAELYISGIYVVIFSILFVAAAGWLVGSLIMGFYLAISLQIFGRHDNEAFSSLKIEDYKNFVRLHIDREGLHIYPMKIEFVQKCQTEQGQKFDRPVAFIEPPVLSSN